MKSVINSAFRHFVFAPIRGLSGSALRAAVAAAALGGSVVGAESASLAPAPVLHESLDLGGGVTMEFVRIPAGSFTMGSEENTGDGDESPKHTVTLTQPFYLGKFEVTQAQWTQIIGANPSRFRGENLPVDSVSWDDAQRFLGKLAVRTGRRVALPTEAQWEYACRAATTTPWSCGADEAPLPAAAWFGENSGGTTHAVGTRAANPWGLHDLHGNLWEWCADWYAKHAYDGGAVADPTGPAASTGSRVLRGGGWGEDSDHVRSAVRNCLGPDVGHHGTGFRVLLWPSAATP